MIKYGILIFNFLGLLFYQVFFSNQVTVSHTFPESVKSGSEFSVEITVNKGTIGGFSKLQLELPQGFVASQEENRGATFSYANNIVKFIWTSLPAENEVKVSFKVKVDNSLNGPRTVTGKFSYVENNVKASAEMSAAIIEVKGETIAAQAPPPEQPKETPKETTQETPPPAPGEKKPDAPPPAQPAATMSQEVKCERTMPSDADGEFTVNITISKGKLSGYAKLHETIPNGLMASEAESSGATFSFSEGIAKFVWVSLPADKDEISVSYKVKPLSGVSGAQNVKGVFTYLEGDQTKKIDLTGGGTVTIKGDEPVTQPVAVTTPPPPVEQPATPPAATPPPPVEDPKPVTTPAVTSIPTPQTGVKYRVQISATHQNKNESYFRSKYGLNGKIYKEMHEGWNKFTIGTFVQYKQARDSREEVRNKGVDGPFVTAYQSGKRITVQEALMITSQQWYK